MAIGSQEIRGETRPLGDHPQRFVRHLEEQGYSRARVTTYKCCIDALEQKMMNRSICLADLDEGLAISLISRGRPAIRKRNLLYMVRGFYKFLVDAGVGRETEPRIDNSPRECLRREYEDYLRYQRGVSERTIETCWWFADSFLRFCFGSDIGDLSKLSSTDIVGFMNAPTPRRRGRWARYKSLPTHMRKFFQFLFARGKTTANLSSGIPSVRHRYGARVPRFLGPEQVESLIGAVRDDSPTGRRNYAMVLLLARLGLRAQEVIAMQIDDIDWRAGETIVRGKGQRHDRLPLPQDVGEALAEYIQRDRVTKTRALFVTLKAPHRPFKDGQVLNTILSDAFDKTGLKPPAPYVGSHVLRHSLATALIQRGAPLTEIADMLRHRSRSSTMIYAKLDIEGLRSIAPSWSVTGDGK